MFHFLVGFFVLGLLAKGDHEPDRAILRRQESPDSAVSVLPLASTVPDIAPLTTVTSTSTSTAYVISIYSMSMPTPVVSTLPLTTIILSDSSVSVYPMGTITLFPDPVSTSVSSSSSSRKNTGAIAGGVVGGLAIVVAAIAAFLFFRLCRQSPRRWRGSQRSAGRWHDLEGKENAGHAGLTDAVGSPFSGSFHHNEAKPAVANTDDAQSNVISPTEDPFISPTTPRFDSIAPLVIRDNRRPSAADPFVDSYPPPARRGPFRSPSFGSPHHRTDSASYIEMDDAAGSVTSHGSGGAKGYLPELKHRKSLSDMIPSSYLVPDMPVWQPTAN